ncbi:MAG: hypothetical protein ACQEVA_03035 [Myxococcota bacterium]
MTELAELSPTQRLTELLSTVDANTVRHDALQAALDFNGGWVEMARLLHEVETSEAWKNWDYSSFSAYCKEELQLTRGNVRKMREGYKWLESEAPQLLEPQETEAGESEPRPVPDIDTVDQLQKGYQKVREERVPRDTYQELKRSALDGERSSYQLRREFKEAIPEDKREKKPTNPRKHLKKALKSLEKALEELKEEGDAADPEMTERATKLRDEIFHMVATKDDEDGE